MKQDRIRGSLLAGAAGDALGYAVEFIKEDAIFSRYGEDGITEFDLRKGIAEISDMPFTLAQRMLDSTSITSFYVSATDSTTVDRAEAAVSSFLYKKYQDESTYSIMNQETILETMEEMTSMLTLMLGGIAGISLLVGGIGIMNIMLVSVTERTREIGIRKAIGAKRRDILLQFLIESVVLSGMGGVLGLLLGYATMTVFKQYLGMEVAASADIAQLALGFSMFVGIVFGLYPANKASKLKPIDALHYS